MKLNTSPRVPINDGLYREFREHAQQVNLLSEGRMAATYNAQTAAPTTGNYAEGDFVRNSTPAEAGAGGSKYVIEGWMYVGGVFLEKRFLTGN